MRFAGYAAVFDRVDRGGDVIRPGASARTLARAGSGVPLLWQHDAGRVIGRVEQLREDRRGLRVIGRIEGKGPVAQQAMAMLRAGRVDGLSFGYRVVKGRAGRVRELQELELIEVSVVATPMQPLARVHMVEG
ncbi:HK97 family phage prohead protease [Aquisediminimonas sediminicola]|uniref:HK97 family phage prohead protease n=1 Tax=Alteraquisediminimonas sediminicola TaxID=2676787 RepID=UPI001C8E631F|nr:HK97 family phage prohead protease [Aquisediminimonas sediminicola]